MAATAEESVNDLSGLKEKQDVGNNEVPVTPLTPPVPSPKPGDSGQKLNGQSEDSGKQPLEGGEESELKKPKLEDEDTEMVENGHATENGVVTPAEEEPKEAEQLELNGQSDDKGELVKQTEDAEKRAESEQTEVKRESAASSAFSKAHEPYVAAPGLDPPEEVLGLPKHQIKFALSTLRALKRLKDAAPFVHPVDAIKLNIPTYYEVIKSPMDLSTMEKKCQDGEYKSVTQFGNDFNLIIENCITFNGAESPITEMARSMDSSFKKYMNNMPAYEDTSTSAKPKKKSLPPVTSATTGTPKSQRAAAQAANAAVSSMSDAGTSNQSFALQPSGIPTIRRESTVGGRPKREIHPPKPRDLPYGDIKPRRKKYAAELKFCGQVLKELQSKRHEAFSFPFLQPVDPVALNCPSYFKIIKQPMDLSTIQEKYNNNQYETADDFEADVRLMFKNCYKFNPEGSPVNMMGHRLENVFDKKWIEKPVPASSPRPQSESEDYYSDEEDIDEVMRNNPAIQFLESQIETMKAQLEKMKKDALRDLRDRKVISGVRKRKRGKGEAGRRKSSIRRSSLSGLVGPEPMTHEMKQEMSEMISKLPEKKMLHVVNIIQESMPLLKNSGQDEIELDIDQLDLSTQLKLYNYVVRKDRRESQKQARASSPAAAAKKKKRKAMTEDEQSRQIEEIQKKIRQFDRVSGEAPDSDESSSEDEGNGNGANGAGNVSSDDSSSEEE